MVGIVQVGISLEVVYTVLERIEQVVVAPRSSGSLGVVVRCEFLSLRLSNHHGHIRRHDVLLHQ